MRNRCYTRSSGLETPSHQDTPPPPAAFAHVPGHTPTPAWKNIPQTHAAEYTSATAAAQSAQHSAQSAPDQSPSTTPAEPAHPPSDFSAHPADSANNSANQNTYRT